MTFNTEKITSKQINNTKLFPTEEKKDTLHENAWLHIFSFLPINEISNVNLVCKQWKKIASNNLIWIPFFKSKFNSWTLSTENKAIIWKELYSDFQKFYFHPQKLELIKLQSQENIIGDKEKIATNGKVMVIYDVNKARVLDLKSKEFIFDVDHTTVDVKFIGNQIFLAGFRKLIILNTEEKTNVSIQNDLFPLASCSYGNQILWMDPAFKIVSIWDSEKHQEIERLKIPHITGIQTQNNLLAIATAGRECCAFTIVDLKKEKENNHIETQINSHYTPQNPIHWLFKNDTLIIADNTTVEIINIHTKENVVIDQSESSSEAIHTLKSNENILVIGKGNSLKVWDIHSKTLRHTISLGQKITNVILKNNTLVTSDNGVIQVWDISDTNPTAKEICSYALPDQSEVKLMFLESNRLVIQTKENLITLLLKHFLS